MKKEIKIDLQQKILTKIKSGQITMRPKSFFTFLNLSIRSGLAILLLITTLALSFVFYIAGQLPGADLLGQNDKATWLVWSHLPIGLIILIILSIAAIIYIFLKNTLIYRYRLSYTLTGITAFILIVSGILTHTEFHQGMAAQASAYNSAFLKTVYAQALSCDFDNEHLLIGELLDYNRQEKTARVLALNKEKFNLQWFGDTQFVSQPKIGGAFIAAGYKEGNIFYTQIIRNIILSALKDHCLAQGKSMPY